MDLKNNQITIREILENPKAREYIKREYPDLINNPMIGMFREMTLDNLLKYAKEYLPQSKINQILNELQRL